MKRVGWFLLLVGLATLIAASGCRDRNGIALKSSDRIYVRDLRTNRCIEIPEHTYKDYIGMRHVDDKFCTLQPVEVK